MNQSVSMATYPFKDIHKALIQELVSKKASFAISEFNNSHDMSATVESIERIIEEQGLKYRVYDDTPQAVLRLDSYIFPKSPVGFLGLVRTVARITIGHKFSGYRLGKSFNTLSVIWQQ
ncbi:TPA: hypothetical protein ACU3EH_001773 [Salmonella enterica]